MQRQFFQVFRSAFNLFKGVIYIVFTIALGIDLIPFTHHIERTIYGKDEMDLTIFGLRSM